MNPYQCEVCCDVCGEKGMATIQTSAAQWIKGNIVRHEDPAVCAENLKRQKEKAEKNESNQ